MSARLSPRSMPRGNDVAICVFQLCRFSDVIAWHCAVINEQDLKIRRGWIENTRNMCLKDAWTPEIVYKAWFEYNTLQRRIIDQNWCKLAFEKLWEVQQLQLTLSCRLKLPLWFTKVVHMSQKTSLDNSWRRLILELNFFECDSTRQAEVDRIL